MLQTRIVVSALRNSAEACYCLVRAGALRLFFSKCSVFSTRALQVAQSARALASCLDVCLSVTQCRGARFRVSVSFFGFPVFSAEDLGRAGEAELVYGKALAFFAFRRYFESEGFSIYSV